MPRWKKDASIDMAIPQGAPMLYNILIVILVPLLVAVLPQWPHSAKWGYIPSGILGIVIVILMILLLTERISP
jgi:Na+/melibiose symporter-like transporter